MYVSTKAGLSGRRGMGATENPDTNVYDAQGNVVDPNATTTYGATSGGTYPLNPSPSLTQWLNANSTMVAVGAAVFVGLIFVAKAGR